MLESTIDGFKDIISEEQQTVTIRDIKETPVALHYKDEFVGYIHTELSLYDVMCQIKDKALEGYSIKFERSKVYPITSKGSLNLGNEKQIFPLMNIYLDKLIELN